MAKYCTSADKLLIEKYEYMGKNLKDGKLIKVNELGGYCSVTSLEDCVYGDNRIDNLIEIEEHERVCNFLLCGKPDLDTTIKGNHLLIENSQYANDRLVTDYCKLKNISPKSVQRLTSFKLKTILWQVVDYKKFFSNGIKQGLQNILFESTFQDIQQINSLKMLLEGIMNANPDKVLNIYIKANYGAKQADLKSNVPNILIHYIEFL